MGWARGLAVMTPRLHRVDRGFDSHRAHLAKTASLYAIYFSHLDQEKVSNHQDFLS